MGCTASLRRLLMMRKRKGRNRVYRLRPEGLREACRYLVSVDRGRSTKNVQPPWQYLLVSSTRLLTSLVTSVISLEIF